MGCRCLNECLLCLVCVTYNSENVNSMNQTGNVVCIYAIISHAAFMYECTFMKSLLSDSDSPPIAPRKLTLY